MESQAALLERSVAENNFNDRVVLERSAVSDKVGNGQLISAVQTVNSGGAYLREKEGQVPRNHEVNAVKLVALDSYPLRRPVHFIKIDIEGAEILAFRGAKELLKEDRPVIMTELHPTQLTKVSGCTPAQFISEMETCKYKCHILEGDKLAPLTGNVSDVRSVVLLPKD
jgi:FkbM family methyltransferase